MERLTYVTEKGEVLFHPEDLPDDEGMTITQLAKDGRFKALEIIAERLANYEQVEELGRSMMKHIQKAIAPELYFGMRIMLDFIGQVMSMDYQSHI